MKHIKSFLAALLLTFTASAWGQVNSQFTAGTNALANTNLSLALTDLAAAAKAAPTDPGANIYLAYAELLNLPTDPNTDTFLNNWGVSSAGRNPFHWKAKLSTNAKGKTVLPGGESGSSVTGEFAGDVLTQLQAAQGNLAAINNTSFTLFLPHTVTHLGDVTVDYGDVQMLSAITYAQSFFIYILNSWNVNETVGAISNNVVSKQAIVGLVNAFPSLLTLSGSSAYPAARSAFTNAVNNYLAASAFIRSRPPGTRRLFNLDANDAALEQEFRSKITDLENSLVAPVAFNGNTNHLVSMAAFFNSPHAPRSFFPMLTNHNDFVWNSEPDPTFGGLITGLTDTNISKFLIKKLKFNAELSLPGDTISVLNSLTANNVSQPNGVVQGNDGNLYGTFPYGGNYYYGSVFKLAPASASGQLTLLYQFGTETNVYGQPLDGGQPNDLISGSGGNLFGSTEFGGTNGGGTVFQITTAGKLTTLWNFNNNADGQSMAPTTALLQAKGGGVLYGSASQGGPNGSGIIFSMSPNAANPNFQILYAFGSQQGDGYNPNTLTLGSDGNLYGTTQNGGTYGFGTIFKISPPGSLTNYTTLYSFGTVQDQFGDPLDGNWPNALVQGPNGLFYGTTLFGGSNDVSYQGYVNNDYGPMGSPYGTGDGALFCIDASGNFTNLYSFDQNQFDGFTPVGPMVWGTNGALIGLTTAGGANNRGTIFTYKPGSTPQFVVWLSKGLGNEPAPQNALVAGITPGNFYGTTPNADAGSGTIYHFTATKAASSSELPPSIAKSGEPPATLSALEGQTLQLTVTPASGTGVGAGPFNFQWLSNSVALSDGGALSGSRTDMLVISPAQRIDSAGYSVVVANTYGSVTSSVCTVTVSADHSPAVTIAAAPANNARLTPPVTFTGTASDSGVVTAVNYWITNLNHSPLLMGQAVVVPATGSTSNWSIPSSSNPYPGSNVLAVQTVDFSGNVSKTATRAFFLKSPSLLTLTTSGFGTVTGKALIAGDAAPSNNASLNVGEGYSLTAVPAANWAFANWSGMGNFQPLSSTNSSTLLFVMQPGVSIQANFTNIALQYSGLFSVPSVGPTLETAGLIANLQVLPSGKYTGTLSLNGSTYTLANSSFNSSGVASETVTRSLAAGGPLQLSMTNQLGSGVWNSTQETISGTVSAANTVPLAGINSAGWTASFVLTLTPLTNLFGSGSYTMLIPPPASLAPPGYGWLLLSNAAGTVTLNGALADGTSFTQVTPIATDGTIPVYGSLYAGSIGLLFGKISLLGGPDPGPPSGLLTWLKKPSSQTFYPKGITNVATVIGSPWTNTTLLNEIIAAASQLTISGPGLTAPIVDTVSVQNTNLDLTSTSTMVGSINPATGKLTVTFTGKTGKVTGSGAVIQDSGAGGGFFLGPTNAGSVLLHPQF